MRRHTKVATRNAFLNRMLSTAQNFSMTPYRRFRGWREVTLGTYRSNAAIAQDLENHGISMVDPAPGILRAISIREYDNTEEIDLANVSPKELGFTVEPTREEIIVRAEEFGLVKVSPEAAPIALIREFVLVQRMLHVAMDPVPVGNLLLAFVLSQIDKKQLTYDDCRSDKVYGHRDFFGGRGPQFFTEDGMTYVNNVEPPNDWRHFRGREEIFDRNGQNVGWHEYQGLLLAN